MKITNNSNFEYNIYIQKYNINNMSEFHDEFQDDKSKLNALNL